MAVTKKEEKVERKLVSLIGTPSEIEGTHTMFRGDRVITFVNGKAELPAEIAEKLIEDGVAE